MHTFWRLSKSVVGVAGFVASVITIVAFIEERETDMESLREIWPLLVASLAAVICAVSIVMQMRDAVAGARRWRRIRRRRRARRRAKLLAKIKILYEQMSWARGLADPDPVVLDVVQSRVREVDAALARMGVSFDFTALEEYPVLIDMLERARSERFGADGGLRRGARDGAEVPDGHEDPGSPSGYLRSRRYSDALDKLQAASERLEAISGRCRELRVAAAE